MSTPLCAPYSKSKGSDIYIYIYIYIYTYIHIYIHDVCALFFGHSRSRTITAIECLCGKPCDFEALFSCKTCPAVCVCVCVCVCVSEWLQTFIFYLLDTQVYILLFLVRPLAARLISVCCSSYCNLQNEWKLIRRSSSSRLSSSWKPLKNSIYLARCKSWRNYHEL